MNKSIELCDTLGHEAASLIEDKVRDETLPLSIAGTALLRIRGIKHYGDGLLVITYATGDSEESEVFQFSPGSKPFSVSATDNDGEQICQDC